MWDAGVAVPKYDFSNRVEHEGELRIMDTLDPIYVKVIIRSAEIALQRIRPAVPLILPGHLIGRMEQIQIPLLPAL
jgi:hypothetical protein